MAAESSHMLILSHQRSTRAEHVSFTDTWLPRSCVSGTHIILAQVGFLFSCQDLQSRGLSNTVGPHQPEHLTGPGDRQPTHTYTHLYYTVNTYNL